MMKKKLLLQILYVTLSTFFLSLLWEFVIEDMIFDDSAEGIDTRIEYVLTTLTFVILALIYPTIKGLSIINNWKDVEKVLIEHGLQPNQEIESIDSIKVVLINELHRRKKAEEGVENEGKKFFDMLDQLPVCFHLQAKDYTVPFANKMFRERFGEPSSGACYQLMHGRSIPCDPCPTFRVFDSFQTESSTWTSKDGKTYLTVVTPFEDLKGTTMLMEMAIDITSEQKAKDELNQVLTDQENIIKERTLDLERSNSSLREFASFAAHDLKEPLRKIIVFSKRVNSIVNLEPESVGYHYLTTLQDAASRMDTLIDDLLRLAQISSQKISFESVDLELLINEVVGDLEPSYPDCKKYISAHPLPTVQGDKSQMYLLFKNLLSNSLKYSKPEGMTEILLEVETDSNQQYLIAIRDNGIGFEEKHKERIFKPFERLHGRGEYSGTGMGLAICKKVVELHKGGLDVQSQVNVGTTFTVRLPMVLQD